MSRRLMQFLAAVAAAALLAGCEGTMGTKAGAEGAASGTEAPETAPGAEGAGAGASTAGVGAGTGFQGHPLDNPASPLSQRTIYFDFDKSDIKDEFRPIIEAHAQYLAANPQASITLEGHADERGTREYNIALGERRANSVRQLMTLLGASGSQIKVISYGEERPAVEGHDESAWRFNRRVEIIYRTR